MSFCFTLRSLNDTALPQEADLLSSLSDVRTSRSASMESKEEHKSFSDKMKHPFSDLRQQMVRRLPLFPSTFLRIICSRGPPLKRA